MQGSTTFELSEVFIYIAEKDKSMVVRCKLHAKEKQLHYTADAISALCINTESMLTHKQRTWSECMLTPAAA